MPARFSIIRQVGKGGMGVVYEAIDRERGARVALKTLPRMDPLPLFRFKREFRSLAGLAHPNLASMYELMSDGQAWCFTMEFVDGVDFISYVRGRQGRSAESDAESGRTATTASITHLMDIRKLRNALAQLTAGVQALHAAHIVHRDLKPSNVLVKDDGHVVILDFGLAKGMAADTTADAHDVDADGVAVQPSAPWTQDRGVVGSVLYMSPEQALGKEVGEATDWYALGVILYEALTGQLPFIGSTEEILSRKGVEDPAPPASVVPGLPADLNDLCVALLGRDPAARPTGGEVLSRLMLDSDLPVPAAAPARREVFVGRQAQLTTLATAYHEMRQGRPVTVHVRGRSGVGKTALVQRFLAALPAETLILSARCYEQESLPYKAIDSIVDGLCGRFLRMSRAEVEPLIPSDIGALARMFPVMLRLDAVRAAARDRPEIADVRERRRRAFGALGTMLQRLGSHRSVVLLIDDLQWGDVDSADLLVNLLESPEPPRLLLVASYRSEQAAVNPCLAALTSPRPNQARFDIDVEELPFDECMQLAHLLLAGSPVDTSAAAQIARESGGSPYFVYELARQFEGGTGGNAERVPAALDLDETLWRRVQELPASARHLLEVVAVAGRMIHVRDASDAAELGTQAPAALSVLRASRLVRSTGPGLEDSVETYHDRVRESVTKHLAASTEAQYHRQLAMVLEAAGRIDVEATASHFHRAGLGDRAAHYYAIAGDRAATALAFGRSAELYGQALRLGAQDDAPRRQIRRKRADALANAGRGYEAGQEYQRAAEGADQKDVIELQRLAGYQYCVSGHIDEGRRAFATVLAHFSMRLPPTRRRALLSLLLRRLRLELRGMRFEERRADAIPRAQLDEIDIFWSVAAGMTIIDPIRGAEFQTHDLMLALRAGEPYRIARALAWEAAHNAMLGQRLKNRTRTQLGVADALARRIGVPHATGMVRMSEGVAAYFLGDFSLCQTACDEAAQIFRNDCTGVSWELDTCGAFALWPSYFAGQYADLSRRFSMLIAEARERGARLAEADLTMFGGPFVWLAADDPDGARRAAAGVMGEWSREDFQVQHFMTLTAEAQTDLYAGDATAAWRRVTDQWAGVSDAMLLHVEIVRVYLLHLRARCALAALHAGLDDTQLMRGVTRDVRRLERERPPYAHALAKTIRAAMAFESGNNEAAAALLVSAADALDALGWGCFGAGARRQYGELIGGDEGRRVVADVDELLRGQGVKRPDVMAALQAPGFRAR